MLSISTQLQYINPNELILICILLLFIIIMIRAEKTGGGGSEAITGLATQQFASAMVTADGTTFDVKDYQSKKEVGEVMLGLCL